MTKRVQAKICWVPEKEGGFKKPPLGPKYSTIVKFDNDTIDWFKEAWSVVVEFNEVPNESWFSIVKFGFLVDEAPINLLKKGNKFKLMEGLRVVATGEIISDTIFCSRP